MADEARAHADFDWEDMDDEEDGGEDMMGSTKLEHKYSLDRRGCRRR